MKYLILDLETTDLDPASDQILEIGAIQVNDKLQTIGTLRAVVEYDNRPMSAFVRDMHTKNGLLLEAEHSADSEAVVDEVLAGWLMGCGASAEEKVVLAGNSIHFDHTFLRARMPKTAALLSHRMLDISATARFLRDLIGLELPNVDMPHRAMADAELELTDLQNIYEALASLKGTKRDA